MTRSCNGLRLVITCRQLQVTFDKYEVLTVHGASPLANILMQFLEMLCKFLGFLHHLIIASVARRLPFLVRTGLDPESLLELKARMTPRNVIDR